MKYRQRKFIITVISTIATVLVIAGLGGCPKLDKVAVTAPDQQSAQSQLPKTMISSTIDSGLTATIGMKNGSFSKPNGNPTTVSTVPVTDSSNGVQSDQGYTRVEQSDSLISYSGEWQKATSADKFSSGSAVHSSTSGAQLRYTFSGTGVRWIGYRNTDTGMADVYLDGRLVTTVDTYSTKLRTQVVIYSATGLDAGSHTLSVQVEGRHDQDATGSDIWIDALDVQSSSAATSSQWVRDYASPMSSGYTRIEQDDAEVTFSGNWTTHGSSLLVNYSGGTAAESADSGAQVTLSFIGTAVRWIGYSNTFAGIANVYIDGAKVATVDTYSTLPQSQVIFYSASGLAAGSHTLTIKPTGTHQLLALGSDVWVDAFDVQELPQDTTPPSIEMTAPANGSTVSGTITLSANASDNVGVTGVQFELDGSPLGDEDAAAPYTISWGTTTVTNGSHTLTAIARDAAGNRTTATPVTVTVSNQTQPPPDTTPPTVSMTAPANGATVSGTVTASVSASDNVGVTNVEFELDGAALANDGSAPYSISWDSTTVANGQHTLTAVASDAAGNHTTASPITVTVSNTTSPPPDTTPPTVSMTAPADGASVSGTVTVSADASDNVGVAGMQFELDGAALGAEDTTAPYGVSWDTTAVANGSHTLTAIARDAAGNRTTATPVTVTVSNQTQPPPDTTPPTVSMTAPANGATVSGTVTASVSASDNVGVTNVEFELDGAALANDGSAPYSISWDSTTVANGQHTLTAVASDAAGNRTTATPVTVTVSNSTGGGGKTTRIEQDDPAVTYAGTWVTGNDPSVSGGTAAESNQAHATATFTFTGTGVSWISYRCTCTAGISNVSIDGSAPTQVDTYAAQPEPQAVVYSVSNLPKGTHTLTIEVTGTYDANGQTAYVVVDAFDVTN